MFLTPIGELVVLTGLVVLATLVLALPILRYLRTGWEAKRADIVDALSAESRLRYFEMFDRNKKLTLEQAHAKLNDFYAQWYGRPLYVPTVLMLFAVSLITNYLVISSALAFYTQDFHDFSGVTIGPLGIAAQSGAYMWVVNDFTSRARRLDFAPSDVHWGVLRLAIALPLGCFVSQIIPDVSPDWRCFMAFGIGAFPLSGLLSIYRRMVLLRLGMKDNIGTDNDVIKLQGINAGIAERLANEDITTISQLAYCDPIRITMRSSLSFNFIIDCMNQALAWVYLESKLNTIRPFGLRGAVEISHLHDQLNSTHPDEKKEAEALLDCVATAIDQKKATLITVFYEIACDPFTEYLSSIWEAPGRSRPTTPQASHIWQRASRRKKAKGMKQNASGDADAGVTSLL
jgi:hypothetical protein